MNKAVLQNCYTAIAIVPSYYSKLSVLDWIESMVIFEGVTLGMYLAL